MHCITLISIGLLPLASPTGFQLESPGLNTRFRPDGTLAEVCDRSNGACIDMESGFFFGVRAPFANAPTNDGATIELGYPIRLLLPAGALQ